MFLLILFFIVSIFFSFLCSILEAVLLSITPSYVRRTAREGGTTAALLQEYKKDIDRPLSAILTLNTIAHTVGAIGVGMQAGVVFGDSDIDMGFMHLSYESIIATVMTLAILVLSEILPKTIGANNWESLTPFTMRTLRLLIIILFPLVWMSQLITKSLKKEKEKSVLSRVDFAIMTNMGEETGALDKEESAIIKNLLEFEKLTVRDIMTPKTVAFMAEESTSLRELYSQQKAIIFSRIPIYKETKDEITGFILKDELLQSIIEGQEDKPIKDLRREIDFVKETTPLPELFKGATQKRSHLAVVVDGFGAVVGLVAMEDLFETLLGTEIMDELDSVADLQQLARRKWEKRMDAKNDTSEDSTKKDEA